MVPESLSSEAAGVSPAAFEPTVEGFGFKVEGLGSEIWGFKL